MKRKHKNYSRPKRPFEKERILEEEKTKKEYGLKNKREIWKTEAKIKSFREKAKNLISASQEEQQVLFNKLRKQGFNVDSIADVLSLDRKDYLNRRLQTVLVKKKIASTFKIARQLITHKKVLVDGKVVNIPSYIIPVELESKISLKVTKKKQNQGSATPINDKKTKEEKLEEKQDQGLANSINDEENIEGAGE